MTRGIYRDNRRDARARRGGSVQRASRITLSGGLAAFGTVGAATALTAGAPSAAAESLQASGVPASGLLSDVTPTLPTQTASGLQCASAPVPPSVDGEPLANFGLGKCVSFPALDPSPMAADGRATSKATVDVLVCPLDTGALNSLFKDGFCDTLSDFYANSPEPPPFVPAESFTLTSSDESESVAKDGSDGHWTGTVGPSTTIENVTITASDLITFSFTPEARTQSATAQSATEWAGISGIQTAPSLPSYSLSATQTLNQVAGPAADISLGVSPTSIPADGKTTSTVTATVSDAAGHRLDGQSVAFTSSDTGETISAVTGLGNGVYQATVTASKTAGAVTLTATDSTVSPSISATGALTQTALPAVTKTVQQVTTTTTVAKHKSPPPTLAFTGANSGTLAGLGALLCGAGGALVLAVRRRRPAAQRARQ